MSPVIPKEKLTAFERWELASFEEEEQAPPPPEPDPQLLEQALAEARAKGHAEGFELGRKEGYEAGHAAGHAAGHEAGLAAGRAVANKEAAALHQLAAAFGQAVNEAEERVAEDLLTLALDLSKAMLKSALTIKPELVLPVVRDAIHYLPEVQQPALLALHPEDAKIVRTYLADELEKDGWRVIEDAQIQRGGCRVETATNQIDAAAETRWQRLAEALGRQSDWLE